MSGIQLCCWAAQKFVFTPGGIDVSSSWQAEAPGSAESVFQPSLSRMHFPTLPKRWRLTSEAKPPKYGLRKASSGSIGSTSPSKRPSCSSRLQRSVSFSSDPVFKVPQVPPRSKKCPNCHNKDWPTAPRSRSLVDLQVQPSQISTLKPQNNVNGTTATIFSNNLRSNSWRNLSLIGKMTEPQSQTSTTRQYYYFLLHWL